MQAERSSPAVTIRDRFLADHRRLEDMFERFLDAFENGAREELSPVWTQFESELERHMAAEEQFLIPAFARENYAEADAILADHAEIRRQLGELGVGVDLHIVRLAVASKLIDHLRAHAHREDLLLYRWGDEHLAEPDRLSLIGALARAAVRELAAAAR